MAQINFLGGLRKEIHHVKLAQDDDSGKEPTLVIYRPQRLGKSVMIPLSSLYKYVDPMQYKKDDASSKADWAEFNARALKAQLISHGKSVSDVVWMAPSMEQRREAVADLEASAFAYALHKATSIRLCTGFSLYKFMDMLEITQSPQAAAQLLLWIQDGLDDLKNAPEAEPDKEFVGGEATFFIDGQKVGTRDMKVTETEMVMQEESAGGWSIDAA